VSDPDAPPLDADALIGALDRNKVSFVAVGGLAAQWQGAQRPTKDLDVCPAWDGENLERLAQALRDIGARLKVRAETTERLTIPVDARLLSQMEITAWRTDAGDIDVLLGIPRDSRWDLARMSTCARTLSLWKSASTPSSSRHWMTSSAPRRSPTGLPIGRHFPNCANSVIVTAPGSKSPASLSMKSTETPTPTTPAGRCAPLSTTLPTSPFEL
jgi:hypothetical protein